MIEEICQGTTKFDQPKIRGFCERTEIMAIVARRELFDPLSCQLANISISPPQISNHHALKPSRVIFSDDNLETSLVLSFCPSEMCCAGEGFVPEYSAEFESSIKIPM
jgi:hypothetical protein